MLCLSELNPPEALRLHYTKNMYMWCIVELCVLLISIACAKSCPTWLHPSGDGECLCGATLGTVVTCNNETQQVGVLDTYCLTSNGDGSNTSVVGWCLVVFSHGERLLSPVGRYDKVFGSLSEQEEQTCGYLHRQGRLCGECKPNHYVSAYSYDIKCYPCTSSVWRSVAEYVCFAYLPLTIFLCVVILFRISVTSPAMNVPVFCCQLLSSPSLLMFLLQYTRHTHAVNYIKLSSTLYGIWNLDFFRLLIPPICLPLNTMQMMALDYLVAVYPLLLLTCFYVLLRAHDRGCRLVVRLWRPFLWCTARLRQQWNIRRSIIDAFATFFLLSYIKLLNVSHVLLTPTSVYNAAGSWVGSFLFYDPTIEYMGPDHRPYAILAILVLVVGVLFPLVLLLLYPMQWFQKCLNRCGLNSPGLQMFMQCFQGYYRDRTDGGRECRYFAAVYPAFRIAAYVIYSATLGRTFYIYFIFLCVLVTAAVVFVSPYKQLYKRYNKLDIAMISCLVAIFGGFLLITTAIDAKQSSPQVGYTFCYLFALVPLVYITVKFCLFVKRVFVWKLSTRNCVSCVFGRRQQEDYENLSNIN